MRKVIASFFAVCLVIPLIFSSLALISVLSWAFDRQFYINSLDNEQVYNAVLSDEVLDEIISNNLSLPAGIDTLAIREVIHSLITKDYLKDQMSAYVDDFFDYMQGKTTEFNPVIDLRPIKTALTGDKQEEFLTAILTAIPVCADGQIPGLGGEGQTLCKPQGVSDEVLIESFLAPAMPTILANMPDEVPIEAERPNLPSFFSFLPGTSIPAGSMLAGLFLAFVALSFWYITAMIASSSWRARLQWLGWMLVIPSGLIFLIGILLQGNIPVYWLNYGLQSASTGVAGMMDVNAIVQALTQSALPRISLSFLMVGSVSGAFALAFIIWGLVTPRKNTEN